MTALSSPHTHTDFCDGAASVERMALEAAYLGFVSLGFSEHSPQTVESHFHVSDEDAYIAEIARIRAVYAGRMRVYAGAEVDRYGFVDRTRYDYIIGSMHYVVKDGRVISVDGDPDKLAGDLREVFGGDGLALAKASFDTLAEGIALNRPEIIGHFDIVRKHNRALGLFDEDAPAYRRAALEALERVRESCALLEVNTGGMARGCTDTPYPSRFLLERWRELKGEVIVGTDSHKPETLYFGVDAAEELMRSVGYKYARRLAGAGDGLFEDYAL